MNHFLIGKVVNVILMYNIEYIMKGTREGGYDEMDHGIL